MNIKQFIQSSFLSVLLLSGGLLANSLDEYQYISPVPRSDFNTRETTIIIREGSMIDPSSLAQPAIQVFGSESGKIHGEIILSSDQKTIIFKPTRLFAPDEMVTVTIKEELKTRSGKNLPECHFSFQVAPFAETPNPYEYIMELRPNFYDEEHSLSKTTVDSLPNNFPEITTHIYDSTAIGEGYIFLAVASQVEGIGYYLMMLNNDGSPFFYKKLKHDYAYDFKMQPNGLLTYAQFLEHHSYTGGGNVIHTVMDNSFTVIDSFQMGNGYVAEAHDFQILPNGHALLFGYYLTQVDMSQYVEGGYPNALVSGGVVQELDADKNVVFQWRSWDHYKFSEYDWGRRSTRPVVSAFHLNTINLDNDDHIFLATPRWAKKINRQTGDIIWHLGGDENEFSFIGVDSTEAVGDFGGHRFHRIPNGHVLLYDNGSRPWGRGPKVSSEVVEYSLDEENKTAELIWKYIPDTTITGWHRGSAQRLPNGNTVIGWGGASGDRIPAFTEVNANGEKVYELAFDNPGVESYRAFRFPFTGGAPSNQVEKYEVAQQNTYDFSVGDSIDTGIRVKINSLSGSGYNEMTVSKYEYAPLNPQFVGKAPRVNPVRVTISASGISSIEADVQFDIEAFGISDPENTMVFHREFENQGLFLPLSTTYNHVTKHLIATTAKLGEFILAKPDLESVIYTPVPFEPADSSSVNQTLPVNLRWTPVGYVNEYTLQAAKDTNFNELVVDEENMTEALFTLDSLDDSATYYWRVKAFNDAGESDWSDIQMFKTIPPYVSLSVPNGGEEWQLGLSHFIQWNDNLSEKVVLELYKSNSLVGIIDTTESNGAYKWEINVGLATGSDYSIQVKSVVTNSLFDGSDNFFSIIDTTTAVEETKNIISNFALHQNYPNPFNPVTKICFDLPKKEIITLKVYDMTGREITTMIHDVKQAGSHTLLFDGSKFPSGIYLYKLETPSFSQTRKMILMK